MTTRNRKPPRRLNRFERLELRAMLASDFSWNNANWDSLAGGLSPSINSETYYGFEDSQIALKMAPNKLVVGFDQVSTQLPESFREDFGLGGRARVYQTTEPIIIIVIITIIFYLSNVRWAIEQNVFGGISIHFFEAKQELDRVI